MPARGWLSRMLLVTVAMLVAAAAVLWLFAASFLGSDAVRSRMERELSSRLGQPVSIGAVSGSLLPRLAIDLHDVSMGEPVSARFTRVSIVTGLAVLWTREIVDAEFVVSDGEVREPWALPVPMAGTRVPGADGAPVVIRSIRRLALHDIRLESADQVLTLDLDSTVSADRLDVSRVAIRSAATRIEGAGAVTSVSRREGTFDLRADPLDLDEVLAVMAAFGGSDSAAARGSAAGGADVQPNLRVALTAPSGRLSGHEFSDLSATIHAGGPRLVMSPLTFGIFGGRYEGTVEVDTAGATPDLRLQGDLAGMDVGRLLALAGAPGGMTGRLDGRVDMRASAATGSTATAGGAAAGLQTARGMTAVTVREGHIPGLHMVREVILAFGRPSDELPASSGSPFSRLTATFTLRDGVARTDDLLLASPDFDMHARGSLGVDTGALDLHAEVALSRELTVQAGTDLRRFAEEDGRVLLPARITGTAGSPRIAPDVRAATSRALQNELRRRIVPLFRDLVQPPSER
jgi:hypothetical protein